MSVLRNRLGTQCQRERFRVELRARWQLPGEDLQSLYQEIARLMSLTDPNDKSEAAEAVARNAFMEALDDSAFHLRILERNPKTIEDALRIAIQLEAYDKAVDIPGAHDRKGRQLKGAIRVVETSEQESNSAFEWSRITSLLSELKAENVRLRADFESSLRGSSPVRRNSQIMSDNLSKKAHRKTVKDTSKEVCHLAVNWVIGQNIELVQ